MQLEPALQQFVDAVAAHPLPEELRELRAISESALPQLQGAPQPVAHVIEHTVIARDGQALDVRLYTPEGLPTDQRRPCCSPTAAAGSSARWRSMTVPAVRWPMPVAA